MAARSVRTRHAAYKRQCRVCQAKFETRRLQRLYCSAKCRAAAWRASHPAISFNELEALIARAKDAK